MYDLDPDFVFFAVCYVRLARWKAICRSGRNLMHHIPTPRSYIVYMFYTQIANAFSSQRAIARHAAVVIQHAFRRRRRLRLETKARLTRLRATELDIETVSKRRRSSKKKDSGRRKSKRRRSSKGDHHHKKSQVRRSDDDFAKKLRRLSAAEISNTENPQQKQKVERPP